MITINILQKMKAEGEKIAMLTTYESSFTALMGDVGMDVLLVGGSLGMAVQGRQSTLPMGLQDIYCRTERMARDTKNAVIISDLPSGTYQQSKEQAFAAVAELMAADAHMIKLKDGVWIVGTTEFLQIRDTPACVRIGLTPRSVLAFGGYKVQDRGGKAEALPNDTKAYDAVGVAVMLVECVPTGLVKKVIETVPCPTISIGAGVNCDGQVLMMYDMLGVFPGKTAEFMKNLMQGKDSVQAAVKAYVNKVKAKAFPSAERTLAGQSKLQVV